MLAYREALKVYMDESSIFDPVYAEFISQIRDACVRNRIPGLAEQVWKPNPDWETEAFSIEGQTAGSGLKLKRDAFFSAIDGLRVQLEADAKNLIEDTSGATLERLTHDSSSEFF